MTKSHRKNMILYWFLEIFWIEKSKIRIENRAMSQARNIYSVGAFIAERSSNRYLAGIADIQNKSDAIRAGKRVLRRNSEKSTFLGIEKNIMRIIASNAIKILLSEVLSPIKSHQKKNVNPGASDNIGVAIVTSVFSSVLKRK